jgi:hypothetical protein
LNQDKSECEKILELLRAANSLAEAAQVVKAELVAQAREKKVPQRELGEIIGIKTEGGVSKYIATNAITAKRREILATELATLIHLLHSWTSPEEPADDDDDDEIKGETYLKYGIERLLELSVESGLAVHSLVKDPDNFTRTYDVYRKAREAVRALLDPSVEIAIKKHSAKISESIANGE